MLRPAQVLLKGTKMPDPIRLAVLLSGNGRTLQNLIDRIADHTLSATIEIVISNKVDAFGLERARQAHIRSAVVSRKTYPGDSFSNRIFELCREAKIELVCMAGFLQLVRIPSDFTGRVLNIHPALLPAFGGHGMYGHHVHEAVLKVGCKVTGCTVHIADNEYDRGTILIQKCVSVLPGDTAETLAERVFQAECAAYPEAINGLSAARP
jgi:phosphoribosylglycinamide formyltransferase-1